MTQPKSKQQRFAPLPLRALRDLRLGRSHLCVLGIVAAFDRLGKNGSGCWASQNKIADIAGVNKARLSRSMSALRDYGYISSEMNPDKRWFRVHRVIYTEEDSQFWEVGKSVAPHDNRFGKSVAPHDNRFGKSVVIPEPISCHFEQNQLSPTFETTNEISGLQNTTIVRTRTRTREEPVEFAKGQDRAEAHNRSVVSEADKYLTEVEALAASSDDQDTLEFEGVRIQQIADDACLPEELNERATRLLSKMLSVTKCDCKKSSK